jgi:hypothetical protein
MAGHLDLVFDVLLSDLRLRLDRRRRASGLCGLGVVGLGLDGCLYVSNPTRHSRYNALTLILLGGPTLLLRARVHTIDILLLGGALARRLLGSLTLFAFLGSSLLTRSRLLGRRGGSRAIGVGGGHNELGLDLGPRVAGRARIRHARKARELLVVDLRYV